MPSDSTQKWRLNITERRTLLIIGDFLVGVVALGLALTIWALNSAEWYGFSPEFFQTRVAFWVYLLPILWVVLLADIHDIQTASNLGKTIQGIAFSAVLGLLLYLIVYFAADNPLPRIGIAAFLVLAAVFTLVWRWFYIRVFTTSRFLRRVLLIGAGRAGELLLNALNALQSKSLRVIGVIDDDPAKQNTLFCGYPVLAGSAAIPAIIEAEQITDLVVSISGQLRSETFQTILDSHNQGVEIIRMPVLYEELLGRVPIQVLEADWILRSFVDQFRLNRFYKIAKRILDILGGLVGVLFLAAILPFVGLAILIESGRPIFYKQVRLGQRGEPFEIFKFRTMWQNAEDAGQPILAKEDDDRATRVGRILRKTHIDEIPQFVNVLFGTMSLVGPRSERPKFVAEYLETIPFYQARLLVKPGVTGWAQVNYGYAGNLEETAIKLEYDLYYIKHRNLILDMLTILRTPGTMLGMRGQ